MVEGKVFNCRYEGEYTKRLVAQYRLKLAMGQLWLRGRKTTNGRRKGANEPRKDPRIRRMCGLNGGFI